MTEYQGDTSDWIVCPQCGSENASFEVGRGGEHPGRKSLECPDCGLYEDLA